MAWKNLSSSFFSSMLKEESPSFGDFPLNTVNVGASPMQLERQTVPDVPRHSRRIRHRWGRHYLW
jgi:hypothetical protein